MSAIADIKTESQARELAKAEPAKRVEVLEKAKAAGKVTAKAIKELASEPTEAPHDSITGTLICTDAERDHPKIKRPGAAINKMVTPGLPETNHTKNSYNRFTSFSAVESNTAAPMMTKNERRHNSLEKRFNLQERSVFDMMQRLSMSEEPLRALSVLNISGFGGSFLPSRRRLENDAP